MKIKICGVTSREDIAALDGVGAEYAGVWHGIPQGKHETCYAEAVELLAVTTRRLKPVLVTFEKQFGVLDELIATTGVPCLQLHGFQLPSVVSKLKKQYGPHLIVMKVLHVCRGACIEDGLVNHYIDAGTDYFVLDNYVDRTRVGSTGEMIPLDAACALMQRIGAHRTFLAGGIGPRNLAIVAELGGLHGVDIDTGVRLDGAIAIDIVASLIAERNALNVRNCVNNARL